MEANKVITELESIQLGINLLNDRHHKEIERIEVKTIELRRRIEESIEKMMDDENKREFALRHYAD